MWFNSTQREEPYRGLTSEEHHRNMVSEQSDFQTGAAWLSSARAVRCWVKSPNDRNPCGQLPARHGGDSDQTAGVKPEEGGDDVKSSWPLCPGLHTCYNGTDRALPGRKVALIAKIVPQFGLRAATRPHEAGIASNRRSALRR